MSDVTTDRTRRRAGSARRGPRPSAATPLLAAAGRRARARRSALILVALIVVFSPARSRRVPRRRNARNIATDAAVLLVLATGMTFVIITAGIDLSVGAVLVFSGVVAARR